ncbi:hypothetical protein PUN28_017291 [Cardiocondyla obscurior]|uniref:Uncharacterized protein n=1 Tax=Cardiocondyla obscurior TaxID=286306 RepID=A0AAW2EL42_9HYME
MSFSEMHFSSSRQFRVNPISFPLYCRPRFPFHLFRSLLHPCEKLIKCSDEQYSRALLHETFRHLQKLKILLFRLIYSYYIFFFYNKLILRT